MWRNVFTAAIHNLFRNGAYAAVNVVGLALGLAAALLIALYVRDESSWDRQWPAAERIFRVSTSDKATTTAQVAAALKLEAPDVERAARLTRGLRTLRQGDIEVLPEYFHWADPDFFRLFPFKAVFGDIATALDRPDGLVLTRSLARQLFGREDVLGSRVVMNRQQTVVVTAVIEDTPWNTHLKLGAVGSGLASFSALTELDQLAANAQIVQPDNVYTYARLREGAAITTARYRFVSLPDLHFLPTGSQSDLRQPGDRRAVRGLALIGLVILIIAAGNFIGMMTARASRRAVEVGVRKTVGALPQQIRMHFLAECLLLSGMAMAVALLAVRVLLPAFNAFLDRGIGFDFVRDPWLAAGTVGLWLAVGVAAGSYPALVLSKFRPVDVLKGFVSLRGGPGRLRQAMVILQFGTLVALLVAAMTVQRQTRFALEDRLRVPSSELVRSQFTCAVSPGVRGIMAALPGVLAASCASEWSETGATAVFVSPQGSQIGLHASPVDTEHLRLLGIVPLAGRLHDAQYGEDLAKGTSGENPSLVINAAAARALGYASPEQAVGQYRRWSRPGNEGPSPRQLPDPLPSRIVGVVPDFSLGSVRDRVEPTVYYMDPLKSFTLYVKLDGTRIPEALRAVGTVYANVTGGVQFKAQFLSQVLDELYADIRRQAGLLTIFSVIAIVVASLGLLGLAVFTAEHRTHEIGVRKCMGASRADILRFIGWQFARPVLMANLIAWPVAWFFMTRWLEGFAYHVELGPLAFVGASALALGIALATVTGHALGVARARPVEALRYE